MEHPGFFRRAGPFDLRHIADETEALLAGDVDPSIEVSDIRALSEAASGHLSFLENTKYLPQFEKTQATACYVAEQYVDRAPDGLALLIAAHPYRSFALGLRLFYPDACRDTTFASDDGSDGARVAASAKLEENVAVAPGVVVGEEARIGSGTSLGPGAVIGSRVHIGRDCQVGPNVTITHSLVGDRVIIHPGVAIGQDGFGFAMSPKGHLKVPQVGRVIIQDDVEIGANTTIDRGALRDTVIGEGTKIDNLVQIGHNVRIGRHCVIVAQTGISGSTRLGDFAALGGQVGLAGHVTIGDGAQVAAGSGVMKNVPPGETWAGIPAKPIRRWLREEIVLKKLTSKGEG